MKVVIVDTSHKILATLLPVIGRRIPVKGDHVCFFDDSQALLMGQQKEAKDGIVEKVMLDYIQDIAIVTVKVT